MLQTPSTPILRFSNLSRFPEVGHFVSTREGGVSSPPMHTLNLSFHVGDASGKVLENRRRLAGFLGLSRHHILTAKQVHGNSVKIVSQPIRTDRGQALEITLGEGDALITDVTGVCLMVLTADCVPIVLYEPEQKAVAVIHAGWKGTLEDIVGKTMAVLADTFGASPGRVVAGIGPSIGPCCYQVGPEVISRFSQAFPGAQGIISRQDKTGKGHLDLGKATFLQLVREGVRKSNIERADLCTCHHLDTFFSHRCEGGLTGRFGTGIFLR